MKRYKKVLLMEIIAIITLVVNKPFLYMISLTPFVWGIIYIHKLENNVSKFFFIAISLVFAPVILLLLVSIILRLLPKVKSGNHRIFSGSYYLWIIRDFTYEIITTSNFLNNLLIRTKPIRNIIYSIMGLKNSNNFILANDVKLLDPDKIKIGKFTFIGINTLIAPHIIRANRLILKEINIGEKCIVGAFCTILSGTKVGSHCRIDSHVILNNDVEIGDKTIIYAGTNVDSNVRIGKQVIIGKNCIVGSNTVIGDKVAIGNYLRIGSDKYIKNNSMISRDML